MRKQGEPSQLEDADGYAQMSGRVAVDAVFDSVTTALNSAGTSNSS